MRRLDGPAAWLAAALCCSMAGMPIRAAAQSYDTLAGQPDPRDFVGHEDSRLTLLGVTLRFAGFDIGRLAERGDGAPDLPTVFEIRDALATVQALGATVLRVRPLGLRPDAASLAELDLVLKTARDMGLKVIVPLSGPSPVMQKDSPAQRASLAAGIQSIMDHVNLLNGIGYAADPTILAWESCVACGTAADPATISAWTEQLGQAVKAADPRHLYESGAFAGRIGRSVSAPVPARLYATPSVDMVGDSQRAYTADARASLEATAAEVAATGKAYVMDETGWSPAVWKTVGDLEAWLLDLSRDRLVSGALAGALEGHADGGGYLPAPPHGDAALYFPGFRTADVTARDMQDRGRALRRFAYAMADITDVPAYLLPPKTEIISAARAHLVWRGSAGASSYDIERSPDPNAPDSWRSVCDACTNDMAQGWQDPSPPAEPAWYRITPINVNGHKSIPSEPFRASTKE